MKGLLIKDFYMIKKYCRWFILAVSIFIVVSVFSNDNAFFVIYPIMITSVLPVNLISYDEKSKWSSYCAVFPYSRVAIVSAKYIISLISAAVCMILIGIAQAVRMNITGTVNFSEYNMLMQISFIISMLAPGFILPGIYKFGVEKGRIIYFIVIIAVCSFSPLLSYTKNSFSGVLLNASLKWIPYAIPAGSAVIFAGSWLLSIKLYQQKDL